MEITRYTYRLTRVNHADKHAKPRPWHSRVPETQPTGSARTLQATRNPAGRADFGMGRPGQADGLPEPDT